MAIITSHRLGFKKTILLLPTPETGKLFSLPDLYKLLEKDKKIWSKVNIMKSQVAKKSKMKQILYRRCQLFLTGKIVWDIKYNLSTRETSVTFPALRDFLFDPGEVPCIQLTTVTTFDILLKPEVFQSNWLFNNLIIYWKKKVVNKLQGCSQLFLPCWFSSHL